MPERCDRRLGVVAEERSCAARQTWPDLKSLKRRLVDHVALRSGVDSNRYARAADEDSDDRHERLEPVADDVDCSSPRPLLIRLLLAVVPATVVMLAAVERGNMVDRCVPEIVLFVLVCAFDICCLLFNTNNRLGVVGKTKYSDFRNFSRFRVYCCMRMCLY